MLNTAYQVIASPSLGFSQSLLPHTQQPILSGRALGEANVQVFANAVNGNLAVRDHAKLIQDGQFSFALGYVYNSQATDKKWRLNVGKRIAPQTSGGDSADGTITLIHHDGAEIVFTHDVARGCYVAKAYAGGEPELRHSAAGGWEVYYPQTGFTEHYDAQGLQRFTMAADGATLAFDYDQQGNLISMQGPSSEQYCFERTEQALSIIKKGETTQTLIAYELDKHDNVQATRIPVGNDDIYTINYHYDAAGLLDAITQSDTTSLTFDYTTNDQAKPCISTMTDGEAQVHQFNYQTNKTIITDQAQNQCELIFNDQNKKIASTRLTIDANTSVLTEYGYNDRGQLTEEKVDGKTTHQFGYDNLGLTQHVEDGLQRAVDFQHDPVTGVLQTKTEYLTHDAQTIKCVTRYINNAKRQLQFEISPEGRVSQHEYDAKGDRVKTRHYLLHFFSHEKLTYKDSEDEQLLREWCAAQPQAQQALQAFKYNVRSQVAQDIAYAAVSDQGEGIQDGTERITDYTWNATGQLLNKTVQVSATEKISTTQTFDGLQRLTCHTDPLGQQTQHAYRVNQHIVTEANGKITTSTQDKRGEITEVTEQVDNVVRSTHFAEQNAGLHTIVQHSDGTIQHQFKDGLNRVVYQFGLDRRVMHYVYDSHNHITDKIIYAAALPETLDLNTQTTQTLQAQLIPQPGKDSRETWVYDAANQLRFHINPEGTITEHEYNAQGLEEAVTIYANQWPHDKMRQNIEQGIKKDPDHDRRHIKQYDQDKLVVAEQDGDGFVTHYRFNAGEYCETITRYSSPQLPGAAMVMLSDEDATEHLMHNARGECIAKMDAENFVTVYARNVLGKAEKTTRYHNKTTANLTSRPLNIQAILPAQHANDQQVQADYDAKQRITRTVTADNLEIVQHYDADDHLIDEIKTDLNDPTQQRRRLWRYDGFGQLKASLNEKAAALVTLLEKNDQLSVKERTAKINAVWEASSTRYHYDDNGLKIAEINPANGKTHYFYNAHRQLIFTINPNGAITECDYDFVTRLPQQTRQYEQLLPAQTYAQLSGGFIKTDLLNQLHALRHEKDSIETLAYDLCGKPVLHTDAEQYQTRTEYNSFGEVTLEQIPLTHETHTKLAHEYNRRGLETKTITDTDNLKLTEILAYNHHGKLAQHVDANQHAVEFAYDKLGRQVSISQHLTLDPFATPERVTNSQAWDSAGRLVQTVDAEGRRTEYTYDQAARQTTITLPSQKQVIKQTNAFGEEIVSSIGDAEQRLTKRRHYNESGRLKKEWDELNRETAYHYNALGLKSVQREHGVLSTYDYDQAALLTKQSSHADKQTFVLDLKNDSRGRLIEKKDANQTVTVFERDKRGNIKQQTIDPANLKLTTQFSYNARNAVTEKIMGDAAAANQYDEAQQFDMAGRVVGKTIDPVKADKKDALAITTQNTLDAVGNVVVSHDALSRKTYHFYDELKRPLFRIDPNGQVSQWGYNKQGKKILSRVYQQAFNFKLITPDFKLSDLTAFLTPYKDDKRNRNQHAYYDESGQCRFKVRPGGFVTEKQFDAVGNQIAYIRYPFKLDMSKQPFANLEEMQAHITERNQQYQAHAARTAQYIAPLDTAKLEAMPVERHAVDLTVTAETPLSMLQKRAVYKVYGEGRQLRFIIDANGKVTEKRYDERGNHTTSIVYADRLANLTAAPKKQDEVAKLVDAKNGCRITRHLFDGFNREQYKISQSGVVTRKFYEGDNLVGERRYAKAVSDLPEPLSREILESLLQPDDDNDRIIGFQYDAAKRRIKTTFNTTVTEEYTLTALGKTRLHKDKDGALWETEFDRAGRERIKYTPAHDLTIVQHDTKSNQLTKTVKKDQRVATKKDYDAASNVIAVTEGFGTEQARTIAYQHDEMNRKIGSVQHNVLVDDGTAQPQKDKRPDVLTDLTTRTVRNIFGQELVERNEAGFLKFKIYDAAGRLRFTINANNAIQELVRDAYSQAVYVIHYNHPAALDLTAYAETGLTEEDVERLNLIQPDAAKDRVIKMDFTPGGEKCLTQQSAVMQYIPAATNEDAPQYGFARPCVRWTHNAYGEVIKEETLLNPFKGVWGVERTWYDAEGHMRAHLDAERYLTLQYSNIDNLPLLANEYAHRIKDDFVVSDTTSVNDLLQQVVPDADNRVVLRTYTPYGFKSTETRKNVVVQKISWAGKMPDFKDEPAQDLTTYYVPSPSGRPLIETSPTGATRYWQWDARGQLVATMGAPRTLENGLLFYPVKQYGYGMDAQVVAITECAKSGTPSDDKFIQPEEDLENDSTKLILHDNRGLPITTQDEEGAISHQSYKPLRGEEAREWRWVRSRWEKDEKNEYQLVQDYQETSFTHNNTGKEIGRTSRSEHGDLVTVAAQYNTFDEKVAEGESQEKMAVYWRRDNTGRVWSTNESGIATISLSNAAGVETLSLRAQKRKLSGVTEEELPELVALDYAQVQQTEIIHDLRGGILGERLPVYSGIPVGELEPINLSLTVGTTYKNQFGQGDYSVSWPEPDDKNLVATFKCWPKGKKIETENDVIKLEVKTVKGRMGVDVSSLVTNEYEFRIEYAIKRVNKDMPARIDKPCYFCTGILPIETNNIQNASGLICRMVDDAHLTITGNISEIVGIQLLQDGVEIGVAAGSNTMVPNQLVFDLSEFVSGNYQIRPIRKFIPIDEPIANGQTLASGHIRLEHHLQEIYQAVGLEQQQSHPKTDYHSKTVITTNWKNMVIGGVINEVIQTAMCVRLVGGGDEFSPRVDYPTYVNSLRTAVSGSCTTVVDHGRVKNWPLAFSGVIRNSLEIKDVAGKIWPYGEVLNGFEPATALKAYIYAIIDDPQAHPVDALQLVYSDGKRGGFLGLTPYANGWMRTLNPPFDASYRYQVLKLDKTSIAEESLGNVTIFTRHQSPKLIAREVCMKGVKIAKIADGPKEHSDWRVFPKFYWTLPDDLNGHEIYASYTMSFTDHDVVVTDLPVGRNHWLPHHSYPACWNRKHDRDTFVGFTNVTLYAKIGDQKVPVLWNAIAVNVDHSSKTGRDVVDFEEYDTHFFHDSYTMWISPLPVTFSSFTFQLREKFSNGESRWITIEKGHGLQYTSRGLALDVSGMEPNVYEFRLAAKDAANKPVDLSMLGGLQVEDEDEQGLIWTVGEMTVRKGEQLLIRQHEPERKIIRPERKQVTDRWGNVIETTDTLGKTTTVKFNKFNQPIIITKPSIEVVNKENKTESKSPVSSNAYNADNVLIGTRDANDHAKVRVLDAANTLLKAINPIGAVTEYVNNAKGNPIKIRSAGHEKELKRDKKQRILSHTETLEKGKTFTATTRYNELNQRLQVTNPMGESDRYGYRLFSKHPISHITPTGALTEYELHPRGLPIKERTHYKGSLIEQRWNYNYFGLLKSHTDFTSLEKDHKEVQFDGAVTTYKRNKTKQITEEVQKRAVNDKRPSKHLMRIYDEAGNLVHIVDTGGLIKHTTYRPDTEGRVARELFVGADGITYQATYSIWNDAGELIAIEDTQIQVSYGLDAVGNRRVTKAAVWWPDADQPKDAEHPQGKWYELPYNKWYSYNEANQRLVHKGQLKKDETTQEDPAKENAQQVEMAVDGSIFTYDRHGILEYEEQIDKDGNLYRKKYEYYDNGLLRCIKLIREGNELVIQTREYDAANRCTKMMSLELDPKAKQPYKYLDPKITLNEYGPDPLNKASQVGLGQLRRQTISCLDRKNHGFSSVTVYAYDQSNPGELIVAQETRYTNHTKDGDYGYQDYATTTYIFDEAPKAEKTVVTRAGWSDIKDLESKDLEKTYEVTSSYDANGYIEEVTGAMGETGTRHFYTNPEGRIVRKVATDGRQEFYLYNGEGSMLGCFGDLPHIERSLKGKEIPPGPKEIDLDLNFKPMTDQLPTPGRVVVQSNQSWQDFVRSQGGDPASAAIVAIENNAQLSDEILSGEVVTVPNLAQLFDRPNRDGFYAPYNSAEIVGSLYPHMPLPQFHQVEHHAVFWHELIEVAVAVAVVAFAPELATLMATNFGIFAVGGVAAAGAEATTTAYVVAGGIMGAASSLAQQGTAMALGDQHQLNWGAVVTAAVVTAATAGVARGLELKGFSVPGSGGLTEASKRIAQNEVAGLVSQAANIMAGKQRGFDWQSVALNALTAAGTTASDSALSSLGNQLPAETLRAVMRDELSEAMASKVYHREFDAQRAAASALGTVAGNALADKARNAYQDHEAAKEKVKIAQEAARMKAGKQPSPEDKPALQPKAQPQKTRKPANEPMPHRSDVFTLDKAYETLAEAGEVLSQPTPQRNNIFRFSDDLFEHALGQQIGLSEESVNAAAEIALVGTGVLGAVVGWPIAVAAAEIYGTATLAAVGVPAEGMTALGVGAAVGSIKMFMGETASARSSFSFFSKTGMGGANVPKFIKTPYGKAMQSETEIAINARSSVEQGAWLYRGGMLGRSAGPEGQFWSLENPLSPGYAEKYGLPIENAKFDFVEVAIVKPGSSFITREAPGIGTNGGGGIEVVVNPGEPKLKYFHMPWEPEYDSVKQRFVSRN